MQLDHLVGRYEQRPRYGKAEHPGGLGVDDQFELGRLHHRQVCRLGALEDAAGGFPTETDPTSAFSAAKRFFVMGITSRAQPPPPSHPHTPGRNPPSSFVRAPTPFLFRPAK